MKLSVASRISAVLVLMFCVVHFEYVVNAQYDGSGKFDAGFNTKLQGGLEQRGFENGGIETIIELLAFSAGVSVLSDEDCVSELEYSEYINSEDSFGQTPIYAAIENNKLHVVEYLVEHGALLDVRDDEGRTPLDYAREKGFTQIIRFLQGVGN